MKTIEVIEFKLSKDIMFTDDIVYHAVKAESGDYLVFFNSKINPRPYPSFTAYACEEVEKYFEEGGWIIVKRHESEIW
jgi:hypothetical protein